MHGVCHAFVARRNEKERRNERNCAGSQKRIFKDKIHLKNFQLIN